jgi:hypothetical protein
MSFFSAMDEKKWNNGTKMVGITHAVVGVGGNQPT